VVNRFFLLFILLVLACGSGLAADIERAVLIREANVFLAPDSHSQRLGAPLERGSELAILEKSSGSWVHIEPLTKSISGWILDKGLVRAATPNGDQVLYGAAVNAENEASSGRGARGEAAAKAASRLYRMTAEYFPQSPLAGEAFYRVADIGWQLQRADVLSRPSAKQRDPAMRAQIEEEPMREVMKKYPHTKWADLAAYHLIDNKLCGDWEGQSKCPDKEAEIYEKYAEAHPQSPRTAEALFNAATRHAALIEIYKTENQPKKSADSQTHAQALLQRIMSQYAQQTDWAARARALAFLLAQGVPTYGNAQVE
jgi:hypothetical protein